MLTSTSNGASITARYCTGMKDISEEAEMQRLDVNANEMQGKKRVATFTWAIFRLLIKDPNATVAHGR